MYYKLNEPFLLRGWEKLPYAIVDSRKGAAKFISAEEMQTLQYCCGTIDLDIPLIPEKCRELLPILVKYEIVHPCEPGDRIAPRQEYRFYHNRYIKTAHWSITGKCNYRCKHCYMSAPDAKYGELDHDTIFSIIDQLEQCGIMNVSITGGEPLTRPDFMEIVDALLERGIRITTIYSNGRLVTDELLDALAERGIHPEFNMSFDGVGHHDWLRGVPGAEKYVEAAFKRCRDKGFPTGAEMCLFQANKHTLRESVNKLASWGCRSLKTNPVSNVGAWKENGYSAESVDKDELYQLYLDYIPQYYEDGMPLSIQLGGFFQASPHDPKCYMIPTRKMCDDPEKFCICGHARMVLYISADGRALPCMSLSGMDIQKEFPLITELGLAKCISDSRYMRMIDTRASEYFEKNPQCRNCEFAMECIGGCRAAGLETHPDDPLAPDEYTCAIFKDGWSAKIDRVAKECITRRSTNEKA